MRNSSSKQTQPHESLQKFTSREIWKRVLLFPGIPAVFLGLMFSGMILFPLALPGVEDRLTSFWVMQVRMDDFLKVLAVIVAVLPAAIFVPQAYWMDRNRYARCLACRQVRVIDEVKRLRAVTRCSGCAHEIPEEVSG